MIEIHRSCRQVMQSPSWKYRWKSQASPYLVLLLVFVTLAHLVGCASAETRRILQEYRQEARGPAPEPTVDVDPQTGERRWRTYDGRDAGAEVFGKELFRLGLYYFDLNLVFDARRTDEGYLVGTILDALRQNRYFIMETGSGDEMDFYDLEVYGPNLRTIRVWQDLEQGILDNGGNVLYVTNEGVFKASELVDDRAGGGAP